MAHVMALALGMVVGEEGCGWLRLMGPIFFRLSSIPLRCGLYGLGVVLPGACLGETGSLPSYSGFVSPVAKNL